MHYITIRTKNKIYRYPSTRYNYAQQGLRGIDPEIRTKLTVLSEVLGKPKVRIVELLIDRLWEEKQDLVSSNYSQNKINREAKKILQKMVPTR